MGFLYFLLITTGTMFIKYQALCRQVNRRPAWTKYINAMYSVCITQEDARVSIKLTTVLRCFIAQREYLQCGSSRQELDSLSTGDASSSVLTAPCGLINLSNKTEAFLATTRWIITAHSQLYLNLTFSELVLPMPYARCDRYQGSEVLLVHHQSAASNLHVKDAVFLCGEHSPFSMVWRYNRVLLVYTRKTSSPQVGRFRVHYQVCDQKATTHKAHTLHQVSPLQPDKVVLLRLSTLSFFETGPRHVIYSIHLLGSRLTLLDLAIVRKGISTEHFHVNAFDGPGPAEHHRRPFQHKALKSEWTHFDTFQAYLQITCEKNHCGGIFIKYKWASAIPHALKVVVSKDVTVTNNDVAELCSHAHHWYCLLDIRTRIRENVEISLQIIDFYGPNYLGGLSEPDKCLLAGITITDKYRSYFMRKHSDLFKYLGGIPKSLAVDSVLPEITTCYKVPLAVDDKVVWDFPVTTFVSYGPALILAIYAYGAFVDLSKSEIKLVIRPSYSAGLIVSCPSVPADGYLGIGTESLSGRAAILQGKQSVCTLGKLLYIKLTSLAMERSKALASEVIICTNQQQKTTTVTIAPHLSDSSDFGAVQSLFVQINSNAAEMEMDCHIKVEDYLSYPTINYNVYTQEPKMVDQIGYTVAGKSQTSDFQYFGRGEASGRYSSIHALMIRTYINLKINATLLCTKSRQVLEESYMDFERFEKDGTTSGCQNYLIPLWNNNNRYSNSSYNTHLIRVPSPYYMVLFGSVLQRNARMGKLTALLFDWDISQFLFIVNISLHSSCSQLCQRARVRIVYKALVSHNIVSLEWRLFLPASNFQITLADMPMFEVLLYITSLNDECLEKLCVANIVIEQNAKSDYMLSIRSASDSDLTPFAEYHLLWTHNQYTWNEAEETCQQLGGMHIASIATEMEYLLVSRMLLGSAFYKMDTEVLRLPSLSPCLLGSPLCIIFIGLRRQNASFSWSDGRPTGYLRWNANFFTGHGPNSVKYYSQANGKETATFDHLLMEARAILQPQYTNGSLCSVLIGSPGPHDMEFVSVPCDRKLKVSGVMCIKGGKEFRKETPLYRLSHVRVKAKDSQLVTNTTHSSFNVDTLYEALVKGKTPPESQGNSGVPVYYESLNEEAYSERYHFASQKLKQTWTQSIEDCNGLIHNISLCNFLWPYNETSTNKLQRLTTNLFLPKKDENNRNTSKSIQRSNDIMIASSFCRPGGVFDGKLCIHLLQKPSGRSSHTLDQLCQKYSPESHVYVHSNASDLLTLSSIFQRLNIPSGQASCHNELGNNVVLHLNAGNLDFRVYKEQDSTTKYVVCSLPSVHPRCPPAYVTCSNGCISELFLCDGKIDCKSGEDEQQCTHLCGAVSASPRQCRTKCHVDNCTCPELYFQCPSGGCIHSSKVCNGHADCDNAEDESFCPSPTYTHSVIDKRNDFIPDQEDSSDEKIYIDLLRSVTKETHDTCGLDQQAACMKGHPACYPIEKMCLYDHTEDGRLKYCRNGLHLLDCEHFHCSGSFKCRHSYCVPTHKVCNGVQDCPYGDDEVMCPLSTCINMLQCGQVCVHPNAICDGSVQCESGEDELVCGAPECPPSCLCSGYAMKCPDFTPLDASFKRLITLILRQSNLKRIKGDFKHLTSLLTLDISYCNVTSISLKGSFTELVALVTLDLSHNFILSLGHGFFDGLSNLMKLDMSWNPLTYLEPQTFAHMSRLRVLSLQHCRLGVVSAIAVPTIESLDVLDMSFGGRINIDCLSLTVTVLNLTNTTIRYDKNYEFRCWKHVSQVISDQRGICCLKLLQGKCYDGWELKSQKCSSLLPSRILFVYCWLLIIVIVLCNLCVFIYKLLMPSKDALLICNLGLANCFAVGPLCLFINWHIFYGIEFAFFEPFLSWGEYCRMFGDVIIVFTQIATFFQMLIALHKYYGIVRSFNIISEYKVFIYLLLAAVWLTSVFVCFFLRFQGVDVAQTTYISEGFFHYYRYKYPIWPVFLVLTLIFAIAAIFLYGQIFKNVYKTRAARIGLRHGKDAIFSSIIRMIFISLLSNVSVLVAICSTTWLCLITAETPQAVALVVLIFPLPSVFNPFLFTLSTQRFVRDCRHYLSLVIKGLGSVALKR